MTVDEQATAATRARYQRIAPLYDKMELLAERRYSEWRPRLWSKVLGSNVLEVGVGTGKNMPYYPKDVAITAVDLTPRMLELAKKRAAELNIEAKLQLGDAQNLDFPDDTFDDVVSTFVFCSVPDPTLGLKELLRVTKGNGRLLMLEHIRAANQIAGVIMDVMNPFMVRLSGANINRRTVENVQQSGWQLEQVEDIGFKGIFKLIVARKITP
jgi:phosphatidylethanolamine/phosphatidyl-N-methylethanolamine N-methyltransferase